MDGISSRHGEHQVAQILINTGRPRKSASRTRCPWTSGSSKGTRNGTRSSGAGKAMTESRGTVAILMPRYATTSSTTAAMRNPWPLTTVIILALGALVVRQSGQQCCHATRATHTCIHQTHTYYTTE